MTPRSRQSQPQRNQWNEHEHLDGNCRRDRCDRRWSHLLERKPEQHGLGTPATTGSGAATKNATTSTGSPAR
jgi:hypothetical protein